jgi:hypothetical protein
MNTPPKAIVFRAGGYGLANRLRALVGYQALARLLNVPFYLCWVSDPSCEARFEELFDSPINLIEPRDLETLPDATVFRQALWFDRILDLVGTHAFSRGDYLAEVRQCLRQLSPSRQLMRTVEDFSSRHGLADSLGVHIRHTDNLTFYAGWETLPDFDFRSISSLDGFMDEIRTRIPSMRVFLSTDDAVLEAKLKQAFPNLVTFPKRYALVGVRTTPIADALSEMLLLSRCRRIVGTYYSSFSKFSAIWGETDYFEIRGRECSRSRFVDRILLPVRVVQSLSAGSSGLG